MFAMKVETAQFRRALHTLAERDIRIAATWALNDTIREVRDIQRAKMDVVFDRPVPFTKRAFEITKGARPSDLEAILQERPDVGSRHYLKVQERGGQRPQTGIEKLLAATVAHNGTFMAIAPARGAKLNAYGNWSVGERNQVMSQLKANRDSGVTSNETEASRKRAKPKKRARYYVPKVKKGQVAGVYKRTADGTVTKVLHFLSAAPAYAPRLRFYEGAEEVYRERLPDHMARAVGKMLAKRGQTPF